MKLLKSKIGWGLSATYLLISVVLIMSQGLFGESFITVILGLPWFLLLAQFEFSGTSSSLLMYIGVLLPIVLNAIILYVIGYLFEKGRTLPAVIIIAAIILGGYSYYIFARSSFVDQSQYILPEQTDLSDPDPQTSR